MMCASPHDFPEFHRTSMQRAPDEHNALGGTWPASYASSTSLLSPLNKMQHRGKHRINLASFMVSLFLPWILFVILFLALSASFHRSHPGVTWLCMAIGGVLCFTAGCYAFPNTLGFSKLQSREPNWCAFLFVTMCVAWLNALVFGLVNQNLTPAFGSELWDSGIQNMNTYSSIDPSRIRGNQVMDAGRLTFAQNATLDVSKAMSFRKDDIYCVAPVTMGTATLASYDFWAVGKNCCGRQPVTFRCGDDHNPRRTAGIRLLDDNSRSYFRLAVQQAEAVYHIKAVHPIFFKLVEDRLSSAASSDFLRQLERDMSQHVKRNVMLGIGAFFLWQLFCVICAAFFFSKLA